MMSGMSGPSDWQSLVGVWWEAMGRVCLAGTLILCGAFVLARLLRRMQAGVRCWIWRLAFLKLFLLFGCVLTISLPLLPARPTLAWRVAKQKKAGNSAPDAFQSATPTVAPGRGAVAKAGATQAEAVGQNGWFDLVPPLLLGVWSLGVLFGLMRLARQYREATALVRSAGPITDPAIQAAFFEIGRALNLQRRPALLASELTDVPLLSGLLRPAIVLPAAVVNEYAPEACRIVLAHEMSHVKRQDLAWSVFTSLASVLFFFHPLVWWSYRELRTLQEICCDEHAIRTASVTTRAYGEVLVRVAADQTSSTQDGLIAVAMAESFTTLQRRLTEMQTVRTNAAWKRWIQVLVALVGGVALLPWQLKAQTDQKAQADAKPQPPVQSSEPERKDGNYRIITVGPYTLRIVDEAIITPNPAYRSKMSDLFRGKKFESNQNCQLEVDGNPEAMLLLKGVMNISSQDDRGRALEAPDDSYLFAPIHPGNPLTLMLAFEMEKGAKSLKSVQGELVVANAIVRTLSFSADELHSGASKRLGQVNVTLDDVHHVKARYFVHATITSLRVVPGAASHMPLRRTNPDMKLEMVGTNGQTYKTVVGSTFSRVDNSISQTVGVGPDLVSANPLTTTVDFSFGTEEGIMHPQSLIFHMVDPQGAPFHVPFKFTDIPLAASH